MLLAEELDPGKVDQLGWGGTKQLHEFAKERFDQPLENLIVIDGHGNGGLRGRKVAESKSR
jgi:hypothetical protein